MLKHVPGVLIVGGFLCFMAGIWGESAEFLAGGIFMMIAGGFSRKYFARR